MQAVEELLSAIWSAVLSALVGLGLSAPPSDDVFQGYVEAEFVLVAPTLSGTLQRLAVRRGDQVAKGEALFELDRTAELAARDQARAHLRQARDRLANLAKGRRQPEVEVIEAQKQQAEAEMRLAEVQLERQRKLAGSSAFSAEQMDQAQATYDLKRARVEELRAALAAARLSLGREDELRAAEADVAAAQAALDEAEWRLDQKTVSSPAGGLVYDTFFNPGEWVASGQSVVSVLPPVNAKVRFFVPQAKLARFAVGTRVTVRCDGCGAEIPAVVRFVSPEAEFTPPVLYNRENRNRLVFMIEAEPVAEARRLHPGQPVDVSPAAP